MKTNGLINSSAEQPSNIDQPYKKNARRILNKTGIILPPFLLAASALVFEYMMKSYVFISPTTFIRPLVILWVILLALIWPVHKITKHWNWTSIVLFVFVITFYLTEPLFYLVCILLLAIITIWAAASFLLKKSFKTKQVVISQFAISVALLSVFLSWLVPTFFEVDWKTYKTTLPNPASASLTPGMLPENLPDIYFIIMDGYGDTDVLQKYFQYDNSEFIEYLEKTGFIVPAKTHSNYAKTSVSIPSTLNLDYIQNLVPGVKNSVFWWLMDPFVRESQVHIFLEQAGYQSVSIATDWDITNNTKADIYFNPRQYHLTQFEGSFLSKTQLKTFSPLISKIAFVPSFRDHHNLLQYNFETLAKIPQLPGPKFVFAHIIAPHPPFVIDNYGNHTEPSYGFTFNDGDNFPGTSEDYKTGYINKLEYANAELKKTIDTIISQSEIPPIILIHADHGPGLLTDFSSSENTCLEERFSIFAAYYLPNLEHNPFPDEFTPVNLFRIIFNEYFSTNLPLLDNKSYYYFDTIKIYHTEDITMQLENPTKDKGCTKDSK